MDIYKQQESNVRSYCNSFPVEFTTASGCWLTTDTGEQYLDFLAGAGALNYGHNNPNFKQALIDYISQDGITHSLDMHSQAKGAFLTAFRRHILEPRQLDYKVQFTGPTGTNAVEAALKLARKVTGRHNIVTFTNGFHGCSLGALMATGNQHHRGASGVPLFGGTRLPYDGYAGIDGLTLFETMLNDNSSGLDKPAAVLLEVVQGEGGLNVASTPWLQKLSALCHEHNILMIVDDIQAGCGRTGSFFSFEDAGITPDIITLSKSIGGYGLPMAIVLLKPELDTWKPGEHNGTFRGNNHAFITATKAIETYWADSTFEDHVKARAAQLNLRLAHWCETLPELFVKVKGKGLMQGIECHSGEIASLLGKASFKHNLIIEMAGPDDEVVKFFAPLTITESELDQGLAKFEQAIKTIAPQITQIAS
ncbi:diaminobutyrate--2-oxoglutarate transaminase [Vibrio sp. SM6]|uniref:Diaminobutyrate--2-oxoglutarate transaminase n=1 Tax=Vibrio agarilyticus TaxID=2726741 RepID=A0A7X8TP85_9VIBR|nr:diaminobutyrate--2-oxoglutarate transaminase [Vibrio agarilyticus]NLS12091.1 diaminobutyrate--2-oxoglutarate transaminase [Vibrio agarilyticus]